MIWMILLRMFSDFGVEVLEVPGGFRAWFQQSFFPSESGPLDLGPLDLHRAFSLLNSGPPECLRKASIYRSLGVDKRHVAELDWWHMSQPDWFACVIAYTCWTAWVIAYTSEAAWVIVYTCEAAWVIAYTCANAWLVLAWHLANFYWLLNSDSKT